MKYNTYDNINGGPRLVKIAKHTGKRKRYISEKKKLLPFFLLFIKRPKVHFLVFSTDSVSF